MLPEKVSLRYLRCVIQAIITLNILVFNTIHLTILFFSSSSLADWLTKYTIFDRLLFPLYQYPIAVLYIYTSFKQGGICMGVIICFVLYTLMHMSCCYYRQDLVLFSIFSTLSHINLLPVSLEVLSIVWDHPDYLDNLVHLFPILSLLFKPSKDVNQEDQNNIQINSDKDTLALHIDTKDGESSQSSKSKLSSKNPISHIKTAAQLDHVESSDCSLLSPSFHQSSPSFQLEKNTDLETSKNHHIRPKYSRSNINQSQGNLSQTSSFKKSLHPSETPSHPSSPSYGSNLQKSISTSTICKNNRNSLSNNVKLFYKNRKSLSIFRRLNCGIFSASDSEGSVFVTQDNNGSLCRNTSECRDMAIFVISRLLLVYYTGFIVFHYAELASTSLCATLLLVTYVLGMVEAYQRENSPAFISCFRLG